MKAQVTVKLTRSLVRMPMIFTSSPRSGQGRWLAGSSSHPPSASTTLSRRERGAKPTPIEVSFASAVPKAARDAHVPIRIERMHVGAQPGAATLDCQGFHRDLDPAQ